jgi:hypothetical protein
MRRHPVDEGGCHIQVQKSPEGLFIPKELITAFEHMEVDISHPHTDHTGGTHSCMLTHSSGQTCSHVSGTSHWLCTLSAIILFTVIDENN